MEPLPIDNLSADDFYKFKDKYLHGSKLSKEAIREIKKLFNLRKDGTIRCDEMHAHDYSCVDFEHPASGIVDRLVNEIGVQRGTLKKINDLSSL